MQECFPVCLKLLGVEEGQKHKFFVVLKPVLYLAKNFVQDIAVEFLVVCANVSLLWVSPCTRYTWDVDS